MKPESRPGSNFIFLAHTIAAQLGIRSRTSARYYFSFWWKEHVLHSTSLQIRLPFSHSMRARWANASLVCCTYFSLASRQQRRGQPAFFVLYVTRAKRALIMCVFSVQARPAHLTKTLLLFCVCREASASWLLVSRAAVLYYFCCSSSISRAPMSTGDGKIIRVLITARLPQGGFN